MLVVASNLAADSLSADPAEEASLSLIVVCRATSPVATLLSVIDSLCSASRA